jgi:protein-S-isoprenylcysteine O-methyltransferase Ste14
MTYSSPFCPITPANLYVTPLSILGILLVSFGTFIRLSCYKSLGDLFTFDLCVKPDHKLVTTGPYSFVRHPAYLGSLCLMAGLTFTGLTRGSWIVECAVPPSPTGRLILFAMASSWWIYTAGVGWTRCIAEDQQMRRMFPDEWDLYANRVRYWFVPGLV